MKKSKEKLGIVVSFIDEAASEDVTGSGVLIKTPNHNILLDYGLSQSNDKYEDFLINNRRTREFKAKEIDLVLLTHNHGDHSLKVPKLFKDGCKGMVLVPEGSYKVLKTMATDSAYISDRDIQIINNQHGKNYEPLYSIKDVEDMLEHTEEFPMNHRIIIDDELSFEFIPSGHLWASCQIMLYITVNNVTKSICYTGDLGNNKIENYFVGKFQPIKKCDLLIGESTYGDRPDLKTGQKQRKTDLDKLKTIIDTQVKEMNGRVLIPVFAQSRCQAMAYMVYQLYKNQEWQPKVYIDSPLAISIFKDYQEVLTGEDKEQLEELMQWDRLTFVKESEQSKSLVSSTEACVVFSTAGMCQVGRVRHHLKALIPNPNATVLFVGFSTPGSLASLLKDNKVKSVNIDTKEYKCRCASYSLKSMSGHAPFKQLLDYYSSVNCTKVVLHHGSKLAKETLAKELKKEYEKKCQTTKVIVANNGLSFTL